MRVAVLGTTVVEADDGTVVAVPAGLPRALLTLLASAAGQAVPADVLVDQLWATPPASAANTLQVHVSRLRRALGATTVATRGNGYALTVNTDWQDALEQLGEARALSSTGNMAAALERLEAAEALWRGPALRDALSVSSADVGGGLAHRLELARRDIVTSLGDAALHVDEPERALGPVISALERDPVDERMGALAIRLLARAGRQAEALALFSRTRRRLVQELGIEPGALLAAAQRDVLLGEPDARSGHQPTTGDHGGAGDGGVPKPATPLVGRARELSELRQWLGGAGSRVWTVVGLGGVGKSHLVIEALTYDTDPTTPLRLLWVDLSAAKTLAGAQDQLLRAARVTAVRGDPGGSTDTVPGALTHWLGSGPGLLVLDNAEELLPALAAEISTWLRAATGLRVLVTSRVPLHVRHERVQRLTPLPVAGAALELFTARAVAAGAAPFTPAELQSVAELCHRLDGLPLAIEIVAARCGTVSPRRLLTQLDSRDRRRAGAPRALLHDIVAMEHPDVDVVDRHRSLDAVLRGSIDRLTPGARSVLEAASAFAGPFTEETLKQLAAEGIDVGAAVDELHAAALVATADGTWTLLRIVRSFAARQLRAAGNETAVMHRLCDLAIAAADAEQGSLPRTPANAASAARLRAWWPQARACIDWARTAGDGERFTTLVTAYAGLLVSDCAMMELRAWLEEATRLHPYDDGLGLRIQYWQCMCLVESGEFAELLASSERVLALADDLRDEEVGVLTVSLRLFAAVLLPGPDRDALATDALRRASTPAGRAGLTHVLASHGLSRNPLDVTRLEADLTRLRTEAVASGDVSQLMLLLCNGSLLLVEAGELARAREMAQEGLDLATGFSPICALIAGYHLVLCDALEGNTERSFWGAATVVRAMWAYGHRTWATSGLLAMAACLADSGQPEEACRLWGLHDALSTVAPDQGQNRLEYEVLRPAVAHLSVGRRETLRSLGAASTFEAATERAERVFFH